MLARHTLSILRCRCRTKVKCGPFRAREGSPSRRVGLATIFLPDSRSSKATASGSGLCARRVAHILYRTEGMDLSHSQLPLDMLLALGIAPAYGASKG